MRLVGGKHGTSVQQPSAAQSQDPAQSYFDQIDYGQDDNYFNVLMDDMYQRMKARAASDVGMDAPQSGDEGFAF